MVSLKKILTISFLFICTLSFSQYWPSNSREHLSRESYVQTSYNIIFDTDTTLTDGVWGRVGAQFLFNKRMHNEFASHLLFDIGYFSRWDTRELGRSRNYSMTLGYGFNDEDYIFGTALLTYIWQSNAIMVTTEAKIYPFNKVFFDKVNLAFTVGISAYKPLKGKANPTAIIQPGINLNFKI